MNVIFFDNNKIEDKKNMTYGGTVRKYYSQLALKQAGNKIYYMDSFNSLKMLIKLSFLKNKILWFHYPSRRSMSLIAIFMSLVSRKKLILTIHDSPVAQQFDLDGKKYSIFQRCSIWLIESLLIYCSHNIIIAAPGLTNYFKSLKNKHLIVMPPGIGKDELSISPTSIKCENNKKIAVYFGSMKRGKAIPEIINIFSNFSNWELHLVGPSDGEEIAQSNNVKYLGQMDHENLIHKLRDVDVILIPYPTNDYFEICMPMKLGSALASCKPIISTQLEGISEYASYVDLNDNIMYIDKWDESNLSDALNNIQSFSIDKNTTLDKMTKMAWEQRFSELIKIVTSNSYKSDNNYKNKWL
ncbi:glycosyltransferase [Methanosarcina sp. KYL-1]|uniref:glycosyltransferase n=1 Tax=Methanosarcina sp. KYL-1 TaxID=2602068 RepID=UPI002101141E|nr:glycosyltransferase [Methanosarcina sp. KYL-1]MCQ1535488.1 glycosyltransferase [Methanosarcina sp. KYL-1]